MTGRALAAGTLLGLAACGGDGRPAEQQASAQPSMIADAGLQTPESVLYDALGDVYLVSNINGSPLDHDDNGFISRVNPDGHVAALRWIDGAAADVTLNAPKGMALKGDTLFVADLDAVRMFNRLTGAPLGSWPVSGASFLNDVATGPDGTVYVTDTGLKGTAQGFAPSGSDAVYAFDASGHAVAIAKDTSLGRPNGVLARQDGIVVVAFGSGDLYQLDRAGKRTDLPKPPKGSLDGVVGLADGSLLVSSWEAKAVYRVSPAKQYTVAVDSVEAPADIGYDTKRGMVLIPLFTTNRIAVRPVR